MKAKWVFVMNRISMYVCLIVGFGCVLSMPGLLACGEPECKFDADCKPLQGAQQRCRDGKCAVAEKFNPDGGPNLDGVKKECQDGFKRKCYSGPAGTEGLGKCKAGSQVCEEGQWSACTGEIKPDSKELCDNQIDDNCNGLLDEGCTCDPKKDAARSCYSGLEGTEKHRPCRLGQQQCQGDGTWSAQCKHQVLPRKESCNGLDDDCNGQIDDECPCKPGETKACYVSFTSTAGKGTCKEGLMTCRQDGVWGTCEGAVGPALDEPCNGKDDDCDGQTDEGCQCKPGESQECYTGPDGTLGKGLCKKGRRACNDKGQWGNCLGQTLPQKSELCNGEDDDCDGTVDEDLQKPRCGLQKGICAGATRPCGGDKGWLPCTPLVYESFAKEYEENETTCDNVDNDCNGQIDENLMRPCFTSQRGCQQGANGYSCEGICQTGLQTCKAGHWSSCVGEKPPDTETCNGADDDCDGIVDNGCQCNPGNQQKCYTGPAGTADKGLCKTGAQTCLASGRWGACTNDIKPVKETCNNKDDDCNGKVDDGLVSSCYTGPSGTAGVGPCKRGQSTCQNGKPSACQNQVLPSAETCANQKDDDCDGMVDETDGRALKFAGNAQRVEIPDQIALNLPASFTVEVWYYLDALSSRNIALLVNKHKWGDDGNGWHLKIQKENTPVPNCGFSWWNNNGGNQLLFGACPLKVWTHIAFIYNSANRSYHFYLNGREVAKGTADILIGSNKYPVVLGTESSPKDDVHFRGQMGPVRISNDIRYTAGFTPACTFKADSASLGVWNLDDGSGGVVKDISTAKNNGKILGPTWTPGRQCNASRFGGCKP